MLLYQEVTPFFCWFNVETLQDNALVIHDYNGFNIWINGQKASTNVAANDNKWHHVAATWQSATGRWKIYKDGSEVRNNLASEVFQMGQVSETAFIACLVLPTFIHQRIKKTATTTSFRTPSNSNVFV